MITYEQAKAKAAKISKGLDTAYEYKGAYVFSNSKLKGNDIEDAEVAILKSNGNRVSFSAYVISSHDTSKPKKLKF